MKKLLIIAATLLVETGHALSLPYSFADSTTIQHKNEKVDIRFVPVISYAPETRFLFGVGALAPFKLHNDSITHHSLIQAFVAYSQNKQDYVYIPYQFYTKNNDFYIEGEADYYNYSYYYWGIGEARIPDASGELYNVSFPKIFANVYRKIAPHFYAGIDYYYEHDVMGTIQPGQLDSGKITGSRGGVVSGGGIDMLYDTRDNIFFPRDGWYIKVLTYFNEPQLGSTLNFGKIRTDVSWYHPLSNSVILALTQHNEYCWGNVPFNQMALIGGTKQIRGYYMGYYRDDALSYLQAEARVHLINRVSFVGFGTMAFYGNTKTIDTPIPVFAEGLGLRYNYERKQHINVRFDAGYGNTVEFYLTIQEAF